MKITVLTVFPTFFDSFLKMPVPARAAASGAAQVEIADIKEYADGCFRKIDDSPYGGGPGCLMRCEPIVRALEEKRTPGARTVLFSPAGRPFTQADARRLSKEEHLILVCGHYEGVDARIGDWIDEEISLGDFILTGGEAAALAVMDAVIRLFPESLKEESTREESFEEGLLEHPQYTRPAVFRGRKVPEVLLSGDHEAVRRWKIKESLRRTARLRPDLLEGRELLEEEKRFLDELREERE